MAAIDVSWTSDILLQSSPYTWGLKHLGLKPAGASNQLGLITGMWVIIIFFNKKYYIHTTNTYKFWGLSKLEALCHRTACRLGPADDLNSLAQLRLASPTTLAARRSAQLRLASPTTLALSAATACVATTSAAWRGYGLCRRPSRGRVLGEIQLSSLIGNYGS